MNERKLIFLSLLTWLGKIVLDMLQAWSQSTPVKRNDPKTVVNAVRKVEHDNPYHIRKRTA
jgi:hypothetical protein